VRHGAVEASGSGGVQRVWARKRGNAVGLTSILDRGQFFWFFKQDEFDVPKLFSSNYK